MRGCRSFLDQVALLLVQDNVVSRDGFSRSAAAHIPATAASLSVECDYPRSLDQWSYYGIFRAGL